MRLYSGTVNEFLTDTAIVENLVNAYKKCYGFVPNRPEVNSWSNSLQAVRLAIYHSKLDNTDIHVVVELELPYNRRRIDVVLFGSDSSNDSHVVVIELKQWQSVEKSEMEGNVLTYIAGSLREVAHPVSQVKSYHYYLKDFVTLFSEEQATNLSSCVYCHNYPSRDEILFDPTFSEDIERFPIFIRDDLDELSEYLRERLGNGSGLEIFDRFRNSPIRPSKKLVEYTRNMIDGQQVFNLIDEQIVAYNAIISKAKKLATSGKPSVLIIKGGPGTGKSVIALEAMVQLMGKGLNVFHATGSSAFTKTLRKIVGSRASKLFKFFFAFTQNDDKEIDVLIMDEAHRIREDSNNWGVPFAYKSKLPQIVDLIRPAKLSIFFIDEYQVVRPGEIGTVSLIAETARNLGREVHEYELKTQFRCSGSDGFLNWIDNTLGIRKTANPILTPEERMDFRIFSDPEKMRDEIISRNAEKPNSARLVAGFCWPWSNPNPDGTLVDDVVIGDFKMPWELKHNMKAQPGIPDASLWAYLEGGMHQVGTVYTIQGFEFDYVGVIFGNDLVYDSSINDWTGKPENSSDSMVKRDPDKFVEHVKHIYRVLLSRAHLGCYVHFVDKGTEEFILSRISES